MSINVETNSNAPLAQHACDVRRETKAAVTRVKKYATEDINVELHSESLPNLQVTGNRREQGQHLLLNLGLFWQSSLEVPHAGTRKRVSPIKMTF